LDMSILAATVMWELNSKKFCKNKKGCDKSNGMGIMGICYL
jgi:hypothetical protein